MTRNQPRAPLASPVDIPFADENLNESFDIQDGGSGTHVIISDVKMTIDNQEVILSPGADGSHGNPLVTARKPAASPSAYTEERHPKFRVLDNRK